MQNIKKEVEEADCEKNLYGQALFAMNDVVLFVDSTTKKVRTDKTKFANFFGVRHQAEFASTRDILSIKRIHPEDYKELLKLEKAFKESSLSDKVFKAEFRILSKNEKYVWIKATAFMNSRKSSTEAIDVIACFNNIDDEKMRMLQLMDAIKCDSGSKLYNKEHTEVSVRKCMKQHESGVLMLIDIDDFKTINDRLGHLLGDSVILNTAKRLKRFFSPNTILGRVGGDEFLIYVPCSDRCKSEDMAGNILEIIREQRYGSNSYRISASLGIALYPCHADNYKDLFAKADLAAYYSKQKGKDCFTVYDEKMNWETLSSTKLHYALDDGPETGFLEYIYRHLTDNFDNEDALSVVMEMVATKMDAYRSFVCLMDEQKKCTVKYAYAQDDDTQQIEDDKPFFETETYLKRYRSDGTYVRTDVDSLPEASKELLKKRGICAFVHSAAIVGEQVIGLVAIESKNGWSSEEIIVIKFIERMVTTFLARHYNDNKYKQEIELLKSTRAL